MRGAGQGQRGVVGLAGVVAAGVVGDGGDVGDDVGLAGELGVVQVPDRADAGGAVVGQVLLLGLGQAVGAGARAGGDGLVVAGEAEAGQGLHLPAGDVVQAADVPVDPGADLGLGQAGGAGLPARVGVPGHPGGQAVAGQGGVVEGPVGAAAGVEHLAVTAGGQPDGVEARQRDAALIRAR